MAMTRSCVWNWRLRAYCGPWSALQAIENGLRILEKSWTISKLTHLDRPPDKLGTHAGVMTPGGLGVCAGVVADEEPPADAPLGSKSGAHGARLLEFRSL